MKRTARIGRYTYAVFVLNKAGIVIASSQKDDIGTDKSSDLYFLAGKQTVHIKDAYLSSFEKTPTIAFSAPVFGEEDTVFLGVVVIKVSMKALNKIVADRTGLGETGEIYLINKGGYMITPSRFKNDTFLKQTVDTEKIRACFEDIAHLGTEKQKDKAFLYKNYLGSAVLGFMYMYLKLVGVCWLKQALGRPFHRLLN